MSSVRARGSPASRRANSMRSTRARESTTSSIASHPFLSVAQDPLPRGQASPVSSDIRPRGQHDRRRSNARRRLRRTLPDREQVQPVQGSTEQPPLAASTRAAATGVDRAALDAQHGLAGAKRMAAQDAHSCAAQPGRHGGVGEGAVGDPRSRGAGEALVGWRRRDVALRLMDRLRRLVGGALAHGCSRLRMQPVVVRAARERAPRDRSCCPVPARGSHAAATTGNVPEWSAHHAHTSLLVLADAAMPCHRKQLPTHDCLSVDVNLRVTARRAARAPRPRTAPIVEISDADVR
jgi:hypothetical protein